MYNLKNGRRLTVNEREEKEDEGGEDKHYICGEVNSDKIYMQ